MHGRPAKRRRSAILAALVASAATHAVLGVLVIPRLRAPVVAAPPATPLEIVMVPRELVFPIETPPGGRARSGGSRPASDGMSPSVDPSAARPDATARSVVPSEAIPDATAAPESAAANSTPPDGFAMPDATAAPESAAANSTPPDGFAGVIANRRDEAIREALSPTGERLVPWRGLPGTPGGPRSPTDSIDGIPRLGTGEPGDPRIPGSGNVNIAAVVERDGVVAQAQERARQGQVHPFLGAVKERVETCWLPVAADADSVRGFIAMEDGVCRKGYHKRHTVGRVFATYDPNGTRLSIELDTGPEGSAAVLLRRIKDRVARAFDEAGMREVPPELLDENGLLRVAWNVYIDDYRECDLQGRGANAHKPGGDEIIGIVELDGLY